MKVYNNPPVRVVFKMTTSLSEPLHTSPPWIREMCIKKLLVLDAQIVHATNEQTYDAIKAFMFSNFKTQEDMQALHETFYHCHAYMMTADQKLVEADSKEKKESIFELAKCELAKDILENTYKVWIKNLFWSSSSFPTPEAGCPMCHMDSEEISKLLKTKRKLSPLCIPPRRFARFDEQDDKELQENLEKLYNKVLPICAPLIRAQREAPL